LERFDAANLDVQAQLHFAPAYVPFMTTRQIIRETKSARYPMVKTTKAAAISITKSDVKMKAIGDDLWATA